MKKKGTSLETAIFSISQIAPIGQLDHFSPKCVGLNLNEGKCQVTKRKLSGLSGVTGSPVQREQMSALMGFTHAIFGSQSISTRSVSGSATASIFRRPALTPSPRILCGCIWNGMTYMLWPLHAIEFSMGVYRAGSTFAGVRCAAVVHFIGTRMDDARGAIH